MDTQSNTASKKNPFLRLVEFLFIIIFVSYVAPAVKHSLFPDQMTRLEKMLRHASMDGYQLAVDRKSEAEIILTVFNRARSITTEIDKYGLKEIETGDTRILFTYSLNSDSNDVRYLTRTKIEADADLKQVRRLEVTVCGRLADQHAGVTRFDGYEPLYECEVPVKEAVCLAAKPTGTLQ